MMRPDTRIIVLDEVTDRELWRGEFGTFAHMEELTPKEMFGLIADLNAEGQVFFRRASGYTGVGVMLELTCEQETAA
jgi:hypothetical protein